MSAQENPRRRTRAVAAPRPLVKCSVPLDVETHAKLCGLAALRGVDRSALAAEFIRAGLKGVLLIDKRGSSDHVDGTNRRDDGGDVNSADDEAA